MTWSWSWSGTGVLHAAMRYFITMRLTCYPVTHRTLPSQQTRPAKEIPMRSPASLAAILSLTAAPALATPQVVTDLVPTGALVQEVMGDLAEVRVLLPQGASAHHYQMRPSDAQALQGADVVIWMGPELTPWLSRASDTLSGATQLRLLEVEGVALRDYAGAASEGDADHGDHAGHDDHADHAGH
ncbi:hypothetical protein FHD67_11805, partial [Paracoccus haeundaensis]